MLQLNIVINVAANFLPRHTNPIVKLLMSSLSNPVQAQSFSNEGELIQSQVQNSTNLLHQGDLILRKCVAAWMTQSRNSSIATSYICYGHLVPLFSFFEKVALLS